jgi:hypothetical protein
LKTAFHLEAAQQEQTAIKLLIEAGADHLYLSEVLPGQRSIQRLSYYHTEEENLPAAVEELFADGTERYASVHICSGFSTAFLAPHRLAATAGDVLPLLYDATGGTPFRDAIPEWQTVTVHALPRELAGTLTRIFPQASFMHCFTPAIRVYNGAEEPDQLRVHFFPKWFRVIVKKNGQLQLAQLYGYKTPLDVVYYLLKICAELELSQETAYLGLSGGIEESSALYTEIQAYFRHLRFEGGPELALPPTDLPPHYFSSTLNLAACVS